jgi:hypothetical protein
MLQAKVQEMIAANLPIQAADEQHIRVGEDTLFCTGVRTHVQRTGEITEFRLLKEFKHDPLSDEHLLIGLIGHREIAGFEEIIPLLD